MKLRKLHHALLLLAPIAGMSAATPVLAQAELTALNDMCMPYPAGPKPRPHFSVINQSPTVPNLIEAHTGLFPDSANVDPTPVPGFNMNAPGVLSNREEGGHLYPPGDTFGDNPPNLLPTIYENIKSCSGAEIINTLTSTPQNPYNLQFAGDPQNQRPNEADRTQLTANQTRSPTDDLDVVRRHLLAAKKPGDIDPAIVQLGLDILEGNPIADRSYSGFPVLHYTGPLRVKTVDANSRTVEVNQIWYDTHIESDAMYIDSRPVERIANSGDDPATPVWEGLWDDGEWYVKYNVYVLNRGHEDFASFPMLYDDPKEIIAPNPNSGSPVLFNQFIPNVSEDQTFFPMEEGNKYTFYIKQPPARFFNLTYHWGWRLHPPRVQAHENLARGFNVNGQPVLRDFFEKQVFGANPRADEQAKLNAISMIGDLAPEKRMWSALRRIQAGGLANSDIAPIGTEFEESFFDWGNRNKLPRGIPEDPTSDVTLAYLNNTIYGHINGYVNDAQVELTKWKDRGQKIRITLINGDYYVHQYTSVDFGGMRGWENTFQNTIPVGGAGAWFTFGRIHWWPHTISPFSQVPNITVAAATRPTNAANIAFGMQSFKRVDDGSSMLPPKGQKHKGTNVLGNELPNQILGASTAGSGLTRLDMDWTFTFEPGRRLRLYQFDAFHHDVAVWSMH